MKFFLRTLEFHFKTKFNDFHNVRFLSSTPAVPANKSLVNSFPQVDSMLECRYVVKTEDFLTQKNYFSYILLC